MGSKTSKVEHPTTAGVKKVIILPQDVIDEILDHLAAYSEIRSLRACALVSKSWVQSCRRHLFHTLWFTPIDMVRWLKTFPVPTEGPTHHVRDLRLWIGLWNDQAPGLFFEYLPWFTNVNRISLLGCGGAPLSRSSWRLPKSVTSLTIDTDVVTLWHIQDIMAQLPNLDDLILSESAPLVDGRGLSGVGTGLRGRFGGRLILSAKHVDKDVMNMLLEIPSGLRFTEVEIYCAHDRILPAVRLAESCGKTLMKLSHTVIFPYCHATFYQPFNYERSFDFSKFSNLQEVTFGFMANCTGGDVSWIHTAISTLRPTTSPRLSAIRLDSCCWSIADQSTETLIRNMGDDLRRSQMNLLGFNASSRVR